MIVDHLQASSDAGNANNGFAAASEANLQVFLDTFICQANARAIPYFFFEVIRVNSAVCLMQT
jgi:hypothetical protein